MKQSKKCLFVGVMFGLLFCSQLLAQEYSLNIVNGISEDVPIMLSQGSVNRYWDKMPNEWTGGDDYSIIKKGDTATITFYEHNDNSINMTLIATIPYLATADTIYYKSVLCDILDLSGETYGIASCGFNSSSGDIASQASREVGQFGVNLDQRHHPFHNLTFSILGNNNTFDFTLVGDSDVKLYPVEDIHVNGRSFTCDRDNNIADCLKLHKPIYQPLTPGELRPY